MKRKAHLTVLGAVAAALLAPALALGAGSYDDYSSDGNLNACRYSPSQLQDDLASAPSDVRQYDPGYLDALRRALGQQTSGGCDPGAPAGGEERGRAAAAAQVDSGGPGTPGGNATSPSSIRLGDLDRRDLPAWPAVLAGVGGLVILAAILFTLAFARQGLRATGPGTGASSALSDYWWALRDRLGR